ncbi:MAG: hypothetical protein ABIU09_05405, partial [Pyrinomonadaceae bacterium]
SSFFDGRVTTFDLATVCRSFVVPLSAPRNFAASVSLSNGAKQQFCHFPLQLEWDKGYSDADQKIGKARIGANAVKFGSDFEPNHKWTSVLVQFLQRREGVVSLAKP